MIGGKRPPRLADSGAPWHFEECAGVGRLDIGGWYCSGVLIEPTVVVTVAHCGPAGGRAIPRAAALRTTDLSEPGSAEIIEGRFVWHAAFLGKGHPYDIGLLLLDRPSTATPVRIANSRELNAAEEVTFAGFGCEVEQARPFPRCLRWREAKVCRDVPSEDAASACFDADVEFLAGAEEGGPCFGDSGGAVYIDVSGRPKLAGIISRPLAKRKPLCQGLMIVTRLDVFQGWIAGRSTL